jgi:hypothetical protein
MIAISLKHTLSGKLQEVNVVLELFTVKSSDSAHSTSVQPRSCSKKKRKQKASGGGDERRQRRGR